MSFNDRVIHLLKKEAMKQIVTNPSFAAFVTCEGEELESRFKEIVESILQLNELDHRLKDATLLFTEMELKLLLRQPGGAEKKQGRPFVFHRKAVGTNREATATTGVRYRAA